MSKKYFDRLLAGSGATEKRVKSKFGEKILAKMGWEEGKGMGKKLDGITDCIQITRREEGEAIGAEAVGAKKFKWSDRFWDDVYNQAAGEMAKAEMSKGKLVEESSSDSSESEDSDESGSSSEFDGVVEIIKRRTDMLKTKEPEPKKLEKSKKIKKDKEEKK